MRRIINRTTWIITRVLCFAAFAMVTSCISNDTLDNKSVRTVLVYMLADNNLETNARNNIEHMAGALSNGNKVNNTNLLAFVAGSTGDPVLIQISGYNKIDTITSFKTQNSTDPALLTEVIDYVHNRWDSGEYGLILWSHGTGWIPTRQLHYISPAAPYFYSQSRDVNTASYIKMLRDPFAETKAFGWKKLNGGTPAYTCMELNDMVEAIPDNIFKYIVFDACYMGNVEVIYAMRKKAQYIVSSACEILAEGFPYYRVTHDFLNGEIQTACRSFFEYYNEQSGFLRTAGISLVKTDGLDSLANCFKKIVAGRQEDIRDINVNNIQCFDRFNYHVIYDLEDFVDKLGTNDEYLREFRLQLDNCIIYKRCTPMIVDEIKADEYCGLSVYIPLSKYDSSGLNDDYRQTEWSMKTGY